MSKSIILGIDPGIKGALAVIEDGCVTKILDMPMSRIDGRPFIEGSILFRWISDLPKTTQVWMEYIVPYPRQNVKSTFTQARMVGSVEAILYAADFKSINYVRPKEWQSASDKKGHDKKESIVRAKELFKQSAELFTTDGRAEAALIGFYGIINKE